ncbi:MAG: hypothetical protein CVT80_03805 [Alphaproteobacteria bacterium HGW-Alphaproteobacteria-2]|nr:MAG: hypothetical protein CVT80_03805 [Alphaproteobacteria bacterium HGW-Alphaproteobacteria-2]
MRRARNGNWGGGPGRGLCALIAALALLALPAVTSAEPSPAEGRLFDAVSLDALLGVIHEESMVQGRQLAVDMQIAEQGALELLLAGVYSPARMRRVFAEGFAGRMTPEELADTTEFFASPLGVRIVGLEISGRAALLDPEVEAASRERAATASDAEPARLALLQRFIEVNALVDSNVVGSMNAQFAFMMGLASIADTQTSPMSEDEVLADLWQQEPEIRRTSVDWLVSYLLLAYDPLSDAELEAYVAFSESPAGQAYNRAVFAAFDALFAESWGRLGRGFAQLMAGERL